MVANSVKHITSVPYHSTSNCLAERAVQMVKDEMKEREGTLQF